MFSLLRAPITEAWREPAQSRALTFVLHEVYSFVVWLFLTSKCRQHSFFHTCCLQLCCIAVAGDKWVGPVGLMKTPGGGGGAVNDKSGQDERKRREEMRVLEVRIRTRF